MARFARFRGRIQRLQFLLGLSLSLKGSEGGALVSVSTDSESRSYELHEAASGGSDEMLLIPPVLSPNRVDLEMKKRALRRRERHALRGEARVKLDAAATTDPVLLCSGGVWASRAR